MDLVRLVYTPAEVAEREGVTRRMVTYWIEHGRIAPVQRIGTGRWLIGAAYTVTEPAPSGRKRGPRPKLAPLKGSSLAGVMRKYPEGDDAPPRIIAKRAYDAKRYAKKRKERERARRKAFREKMRALEREAAKRERATLRELAKRRPPRQSSGSE